MGVGDELMAAGHAKVVHDRTGLPILIVDQFGEPRWHDVWRGLDFIVNPAEPAPLQAFIVQNATGCRPYIEYPFTQEQGWRWTGWRARDHRPVVKLFPEDLAVGLRMRKLLGDYVLIEPSLKADASRNKLWPRDRYQAVVDTMFREVGFARVVHQDKRDMRNMLEWHDLSFREAMGALFYAKAYVGAEGGLHHAAAALNVPAVVIFGGAVDARITGYPEHFNLDARMTGREPCGSWLPCTHCVDVLADTTVDQVVAALRAILGGMVPLSARPEPSAG